MNRQENIDPATGWLDRLCHLNAANTAQRGRAPHKPLLLLCVLDMVEDGAITTPWIAYSPELFFRFQCYWALVLDRQRNRPDMRLPFHGKSLCFPRKPGLNPSNSSAMMAIPEHTEAV